MEKMKVFKTIDGLTFNHLGEAQAHEEKCAKVVKLFMRLWREGTISTKNLTEKDFNNLEDVRLLRENPKELK